MHFSFKNGVLLGNICLSLRYDVSYNLAARNAVNKELSREIISNPMGKPSGAVFVAF